MPQIAQQDYIRIRVADTDVTVITDAEKDEIRKHIANWPDIIVEDNGGIQIRFIAFSPDYDENKNALFYYDYLNGDIVVLILGE